jgi:hypothetical protein
MIGLVLFICVFISIKNVFEYDVYISQQRIVWMLQIPHLKKMQAVVYKLRINKAYQLK